MGPYPVIFKVPGSDTEESGLNSDQKLFPEIFLYFFEVSIGKKKHHMDTSFFTGPVRTYPQHLQNLYEIFDLQVTAVLF